MRRLILTVTVTAAVMLSVAAPAAAAPPEQSQGVFPVRVTCDGGATWLDYMATGTVGFLVDGPAGAVAILFGGTYHQYNAAGDEVLTLEWAPPSGLLAQDRLEVCEIDRELGEGWSSGWDPAYVLFTPTSAF